MVGQKIQEAHNQAESALAKQRARYFLSMREAGMNNAAIARSQGISRERVGQIFEKAKTLGWI